jgi:putative transposase
MGRSPRPVDTGLVYHALNRGNNREVVFHDDDDFRAFLLILGQTQQKYPFRLYGYCLMSNHFHLLLRPEPGVSISRVFQSLTVAHTGRHHRRYQTGGHLWQGRFKSPVVQEDEHFWTVLRYIEANPLRAGIVTDPRDYPWSSYASHGLGRPDPLLSPFPEWDALGPDEKSRRSAWRAKVRAALPASEQTAIGDSLRGGRPFGHPDWVRNTAESLGISWERRPRGRPRKSEM